MSPLAQQYGFKVMEMERFSNILTCLRGYSVSEQSGHDGDDTWMQKQNMLRNMNSLEVNMYRRSFEILWSSKNGSLVVDDEFVASRAKDVESKAFSSRKTGKDGPVADCVADSSLCLLLGKT